MNNGISRNDILKDGTFTYNGILNIYKEKGFTSHDVVAKLRGILKQKKIGHTGTLDPDATGVLPICLGSGTKLCDMITDRSKVYQAVLRLGIDTDTQDISGKVLHKIENISDMRLRISDNEIREAVNSFVGEYEQLPPMYSAIKIQGRKLYEIAREGKEVERKTRQVQIYSIEIQEIDFPRVKILVECSKGTYIRTLCKDIGDKLSSFGCMEELERQRSGLFLLESSMKLCSVEEAVRNGTINRYIIPIEKMFEDYRGISVKENFDKILQNGNPLSIDMLEQETAKRTVANWNMELQRNFEYEEGEYFRVYDSKKQFRAVYIGNRERKTLKPYKMFYV